MTAQPCHQVWDNAGRSNVRIPDDAWIVISETGHDCIDGLSQLLDQGCGGRSFNLGEGQGGRWMRN